MGPLQLICMRCIPQVCTAESFCWSIPDWCCLVPTNRILQSWLVQVSYKFCTTTVLGSGLAYPCTYLYILVQTCTYPCTYLYKSCTSFAQPLHCGKSCTRRKTGKNIFGLPCSFARRNQQCFLRMRCLMTVFWGMEWNLSRECLTKSISTQKTPCLNPSKWNSLDACLRYLLSMLELWMLPEAIITFYFSSPFNKLYQSALKLWMFSVVIRGAEFADWGQ